MKIEQALRTDNFQEQDARTPERKSINEILDGDNSSEKFNIV